MVLVVERGGVLFDVASPLVGDVGLEFGRLCCTWSIVTDACVERVRVVWIILVGEWREEVSKGFVVNVWEIVLVQGLKVNTVDAWWVREDSVRISHVGRHGCDDVLEGLKGGGTADR